MKQPIFKPAKDIKAGDKVKNEKGEILTIKKVSKGFMNNSVQFDFKEGGWSCIDKSESVETF